MGIVIPYKPRALQRQVHEGLKRFNVLVCHRRFGKTVLCVNQLIRASLECRRSRPRHAYIAPLYRQAKQVAWDYLRYYTAPIPGRQVNESELRVDLPGGRRIQLFGADNPDALRGIYLDGVVLDEYAQMSPRLWGEVIRPALSDRKGWAVFIGTPQGYNAFHELYEMARGREDWLAATYRASETGIIEPDELELARATMSEDEFAQEFECSFSAAVRGAYYAHLVGQAERDGRVCRVPYDTAVPVETWWDLGVGDPTAIWFVQRVAKEIHVVDYYESSGEGLAHYAKVLQERGYVYGDHIIPHDGGARELGTGKTREEVLRSLGLHPRVMPRQRVEDGIEAVRNIIPRCWFDAEKCKTGLDALRQYRKDWDDKRQVFRDAPLHDWTSHAADAFRTGALHRGGRASDKGPREIDTSWIV